MFILALLSVVAVAVISNGPTKYEVGRTLAKEQCPNGVEYFHGQVVVEVSSFEEISQRRTDDAVAARLCAPKDSTSVLVAMYALSPGKYKISTSADPTLFYSVTLEKGEDFSGRAFWVPRPPEQSLEVSVTKNEKKVERRLFNLK